jgi:hypothetical protein
MAKTSPATTQDSRPATVVDVLKRIEARISDPAHWCQEVYARGKSGRIVDLFGHAVMSVCLEGARLIESPHGNRKVVLGVSRHLHDAAAVLYPKVGGPVSVNDDLGHDAVMAVVRRAIADAEIRP